MNERNTMSKRIDYEQIATKTDYAELNQKLAKLAQQEPPKSRKTVADLLEPLRERLLALQRKGWTSLQLAEELKAAGMPVGVSRVRECINRWTNKVATKRRGKERGKPAASHAVAAPLAANLRSKGAGSDGHAKFGLV
jgi:hypothetical protein